MTSTSRSDHVRIGGRVRRTLAGLALGAAGALALLTPGTGAAMTSDRAFDRYLEVTWAQTSAELDCQLDGDWYRCERAERLERGAASWLDRYQRLSARELAPVSDGYGYSYGYGADDYSEPSYSTPVEPSGPWAQTCPNGSCYGDPSETTGRPRTNYVRPYYRSDGTYVGGYYRS